MSIRSTRRSPPRLRSRSSAGLRKPPNGIELNFNLTESVDRFVSAVENGEADEIACYGARGDGKTQGALIAMMLHAVRHDRAGFDLPTIWMGVTDTFESHKQKTIPSSQEPHWEGRWKVYEQNHLAVFRVERKEQVHLSLFGIEDKGATDRVRRAAHGMWFEEAAPTSVMVQSAGISELAWGTGLTSLRLPSYSNPAILTENYPDENHWTWKHWQPGDAVVSFHPEFPRRMSIRIPPGERASAEQRQKWMEALKDRPDILRRLLAGQPGTIQLGPQVAVEFDRSKHASKERVFPIKGEPLVIGQDFGHTPATIIGQPWRGFIRVYASLTIERGGVKQLLEQSVLPWVHTRAPWALSGNMIVGRYDPSAADEETDIERNPVDLLEKHLPGYWQAGPVSWEARKNLLLPVFNRHAAPGVPALVIDPVDGAGLVKALDGAWYYPQTAAGELRSDQPKKPNHPHEDYGDGFCYFLDGCTESASMPRGPVKVETAFDPREIPGRGRVETEFLV